MSSAFARRYGGHCAVCGVVRDYHDRPIAPKAPDHAFVPKGKR